jgi:hypothetical protein
VYAFRAGGAGLVAVLGLLKALPGAFLAREEFLAAVTGNPESVDGAEEVISTRLQAG